MFICHHVRRQLKPLFKLLAGCGLASALLLFSLPVQAASSTAGSSPLPIDISVSAGFDSTSYREQYWTPVFIALNNRGPAFQGTLSLNLYAGRLRNTGGDYPSPWKFERSVTLPRGAQKQITVYMPFYSGTITALPPQGVNATLCDTHGKNCTSASTDTRLSQVQTDDLFIGTFSDQDATFGPLNNATLPVQRSMTLSPLDASTMPTMAAALKSLDVIILDDFTTSTLSPTQLMALQTWVNLGGTLIEVGGPQWQRTLGSLPDSMLPVKIDATTTLPQNAHLLPESAPLTVHPSIPATSPSHAASFSGPLIASTATLRPQSAFLENNVVLSYGTIPLIVKARQGQGSIVYLAVDPASQPLATWPGTQSLWTTLLLTGLGDRLLISNTAFSSYSGPGQYITHGNVLTMLTPGQSSGPWIIVSLLLGYVLLLGPLRLLAVKRLHYPRRWGWRIIMVSIVLFSVLSFGLAYYQNGASLTNNSISLIQLNQGGSSAHVTTYMGIYVPTKNSYDLHVPGESLIEPISRELLSNGGVKAPPDDLSTNVVYGDNGTDLNLLNREAWSFHPTIIEQDHRFHGSLTPHLTLNKNRLTGTITNTLYTSLSDAYILLPHGFISVGAIPAGATTRVDLPLQTLPPGETFADQIARSGGLPDGYFPYAKQQLPQSDFQRHAALLSALNGLDFRYARCPDPCSRHIITDGDIFFILGDKVPNPQMINKPDPLLAADSSATLIAWADSDLAGMNQVTVNGKQPSGNRQNFVQMPLPIDFATSERVPSDFIAGQVLDVQGDTAQIIQPGIYNMSDDGRGTGITFLFTLPGNLNARPLTLKASDQAVQQTSAPTSIGTLKARLYNWLTNSWDTIAFNGAPSTITNTTTYVNPAGQLLLNITNQDGYKGQIFFNKPTLTLDNT